MSTKTSKRRKGRKRPSGWGRGLAAVGLGAFTLFQPEAAILTIPGILALMGAGK